MSYDKNLELIAPGSSVVLTANGYAGGLAATNKVVVQPAGNSRRVLHLRFSALGGTTPTCRFYVGVSHDGGANFRWVACSAAFQTAALSGGAATQYAAEVAAGRDPLLTMDTATLAAGKIEIPFDFDAGKNNCLVGVAVVLTGTSPTVSLDACWVSNSIR